MRRLLFILTLVFAPLAAAQEAAPDLAAARLIVEALPQTGDADWVYRWDAVSIRVSRHMHWHLPDPDPRERPADAVLRRNGWIDALGAHVGVTAYGDDAGVRELVFELRRAGDVMARLAEEGVAVETLREGETESEFRITPPGRRAGHLTRERRCTHPGSRAARRCWMIYTLRFERYAWRQ